MKRPLALLIALFPCVTLADATTPKFELNGNVLKVPGSVGYAMSSDRLKAEATPALAHVKAYLDAKSYISLLRIEVHSDSQGEDAFNQKLSEQRAMSVAKWLVAKGVDCKRVIPVGFGESKPVAVNDTAEGREQNRRVVFVNAALRGRAIGGQPVDGGGRVAGDPCK